MKRLTAPVLLFVCGALGGSFVLGPVLHGQGTTPAAGTIVFPKELTSYREVVKKVLPAVVSIESRFQPKPTTSMQRRRPLMDDSRIPEEFRKFFRGMEEMPFSLPNETPTRGFGSGFLVDPQGTILTNFHVVDGATQVEVKLKDGSTYTSKDVHGDRKTDLAIVRIDTKGKTLPYLELGDSDAMEIGDRVLAVGAPFGLTGSVTAGIISAKGRNGLQMNMYEDFLQTDAAINPGNSGGPLVNLEGKVIGINAAIKTRTGGFQGVGLAVASNLAKNIMKSLLHDGLVHRGYLGVRIKNLSPDVADRLGVHGQTGVVVSQVFEKSPAGLAGIKPGDVITDLNGKAVKDGRELQTVVAGLPLKKPVPVRIVRDGKAQTVQVTIEEQPDAYGLDREPTTPRKSKKDQEPVGVDKVGVELTDLTTDLADELGYKKGAQGAVVTKVAPNGAAATAGLRRGMLIVKVDKKPVDSASAVQDAFKKASLDKGVLLQVATPQGGTDYLVLKAEPVK